MNDFSLPTDRSHDNLIELGVAVGVTAPDQLHIGLLYRLDQGEVRFCHFAFHLFLKDEAPNPDFIWAQSPLHPVNRRQLAAYIAGLHSANYGKIPYGFSFRGECFDPESGEYLPQPIGKGLTCATFVLAVFRSLGFDILQLDEWIARPEDNVWQQSFLSTMRKHGAAEDHVSALANDVGAPRFRPEEVAAGVASPDSPIGFGKAITRGAQILSQVSVTAP